MATIISAFTHVIGIKLPSTIAESSEIPLWASAPSLPAILHTPSKLTHYLKHAENHLGVTNTRLHEWALHNKGFGPDILHLVKGWLKAEELTELGISCGNAMWLKQGAEAWWTGPEARTSSKCKASELPVDEDLDDKWYWFEKCWKDGSGAASYFGNKIQPEDPDTPLHDYEWWFFCPLYERMEQLPPNHVPRLAPGQGFDEDGLKVLWATTGLATCYVIAISCPPLVILTCYSHSLHVIFHDTWDLVFVI
jgi:hypothetical protein